MSGRDYILIFADDHQDPVLCRLGLQLGAQLVAWAEDCLKACPEATFGCRLDHTMPPGADPAWEIHAHGSKDRPSFKRCWNETLSENRLRAVCVYLGLYDSRHLPAALKRRATAVEIISDAEWIDLLNGLPYQRNEDYGRF